MVVFLGTLLGFFLGSFVGRALRCIEIYTKIQRISNFSHIRLYRVVCSYLVFGSLFVNRKKTCIYLIFPSAAFLVCSFNYFFIEDVFVQIALNLVFCLLLLISIIDYKTKFIPDSLSYSVFWLGALVQYNHGVEQLVDALKVALVVYLSLKILQQFYLLGFARDALGDADPLLAFSIGIWINLQNVPYLFLLAVFVTLIPIIFFTRLKSSLLTIQIPFGPGLSIAGFLLIELKFVNF